MEDLSKALRDVSTKIFFHFMFGDTMLCAGPDSNNSF